MYMWRPEVNIWCLLRSLSAILLTQSLPLSLEHNDYVGLVGQRDLGVLLSLPPWQQYRRHMLPCPALMWIPGSESSSPFMVPLLYQPNSSPATPTSVTHGSQSPPPRCNTRSPVTHCCDTRLPVRSNLGHVPSKALGLRNFADAAVAPVVSPVSQKERGTAGFQGGDFSLKQLR